MQSSYLHIGSILSPSFTDMAIFLFSKGYIISHTDVRISVSYTSMALLVEKGSFYITQYNVGLGKIFGCWFLSEVFKKRGHFKILRKAIGKLQCNDQLTHYTVCTGAWAWVLVLSSEAADPWCRPCCMYVHLLRGVLCHFDSKLSSISRH